MHSIDELQKVFSYDPLTGVIKWKISPTTHVRAGDIAGSKRKSGESITVNYESIKYYAHRLAWALVHGEWPEGLVDHKDGNGQNNRLDNLRLATNSQNQQNTKARPTKSGFPGVHITGSGKFTATICINKKPKSLGSFDKPEDAHKAYLEAKKKYHSHYNGRMEKLVNSTDLNSVGYGLVGSSPTTPTT